ncbi:glutamine--fructose-6-phosphate transaminase (isomerizing) [Nevskia soli]|uniref:glutamine--fructose-6-phosphate transaminase (isomerizing) n=1 Tax=Nevskia soli TaxID=418856 RepID=UPI0004A733CA|nr:glutamine--fructose-6-phosphate transaminase (isomerizing) [Nevskia soli]
MCGIVGAVAQRNITPILLEGLRRLEYRGYDSAGIAVLDRGRVGLRRAVGKVAQLEAKLAVDPLNGQLGIAHTRWATHGGVTEANAHPHVSGDRVAVIHNGIIENYEPLKAELQAKGYVFKSETDTEVIAHLVHDNLKQGVGLAEAVREAVRRFTGAYAIVVFDAQAPDRFVVARIASPLVIGLGFGENFVASDVSALLPVTQRFIYMEEGDIAEITREAVYIFGADGHKRERKVHDIAQRPEAAEKGQYRHFMLKEIFEQPEALVATLGGRIANHHVLPESLGPRAAELLGRARNIHIVACGTSYHAGLVAKYWIEELARLPCSVELASEYRYRTVNVPADTLFVTLSQSGETADTLAALRYARHAGYVALLTICNSAQSSMVRESDLVMLTHAGPEIGVASTKAFTTQLLAVLIVAAMLGRYNGLSKEQEAEVVRQLYSAAGTVEKALEMDPAIQKLAELFVEKHHTLFLGRGPMFPVALEGALKLKEISYIHAEGYAAGELKHGPLALIDEDMPVVVVAPNNDLLDKLKSNIQVVRARGGQLFVMADVATGLTDEPGTTVIPMPHADTYIAPIVYTVPLQLLAYHVAVLKGTDVDQPRNLAKSVTVE